ncbi:MAG: hypothetical protein Q8P61_00860 [Candidatus Nanopelagicales bacterium]|nr:hypothetical protein [Candidatus Nanopelagicales bacterium]
MNPPITASAPGGQLPPASASPFDQVLAELRAGANSHRELAKRTGMSEGMINALVDYLKRTGLMTGEELAFGCPPRGCSECPSAASGNSACAADPAGFHEDRDRRRPMLTVLSPTVRACSPE